MDTVCSTLFPGKEFHDEEGCLKPIGHTDHHVCKTDKGVLMAWEDDYECTCGCWEEYEAGDSRVCMIYWEVNSINE